MRVRCIGAALAAVLCWSGNAQAITNIYTQDFESVTLGDSVNERLGFPIETVEAGTPDFAPVAGVYSATGPAGWVVDNGFDNFGATDLDNPSAPVGTIIGNTGVLNQGISADGVDEWEGWSFVDKNFWVEAAGDQDRSGFLGGTGTVAVADPDEYDDLGDGRGGGYYNTGLSTPLIDITGVADFSFLDLTFNDSWRPEAFDDEHEQNPTLNANAGGPGAAAELNNQTAVVRAQFFDAGGTPVPGVFDPIETPLIYDSDGGDPLNAIPASPTFRDDEVDATQLASVLKPSGAASVQFTFGLINAGNDWWWAIDNINLEEQGVPGSLFSEDFEGVALGASVNEQRSLLPTNVTAEQGEPNTSAISGVFTNVPPAGVTVDNSNIPTPPLGNNDDGVYEWEGWSFSDKDFWADVAGQGRGDFDKASGVAAIADGDEWDDLNDPDGIAPMDTLMATPVLNIPDDGRGQVRLVFDSSWRAEDLNEAVITVDFGDGNGPQVILNWQSNDDNGLFKDDNTNETVIVDVPIPDGATTAQYAFQYIGGDDWWWAIDNIRVSTIPEPTSAALVLLGLSALGLRRRS